MTTEEQYYQALSERFVPYDCSGCFTCFTSKLCIFSRPPQTPEEIESQRRAENKTIRDRLASDAAEDQLEL